MEEDLMGSIEPIVNWTYPGLAFHYKDCDLTEDVSNKFQVDQILRNGYFLDVSTRGGGMHFNTRFLIASSKAAKLFEVNPDHERFGHCCINANSYFKVLDIYKIGGKTQILLLHIPTKGISYFSKVKSNIDTQVIEMGRKNFESTLQSAPIADLLEPFWIKRTNFPVGMDAYDQLYPVNESTPLPPGGENLFNGIRALTKDTGDLNLQR